MDFSIKLFLFYATAFGSSFFLALCVLLIATSKGYPVISRSKKEKCFIDPASGKSILFPSINENASLDLSVVIPAYNEEERLVPMLEECVDYLENRANNGKFSYEIIVVSDGSTDDTTKVAGKWCEKLGVDKFRVLALETNRGKGGAVRLGMQSARGALLLFADADGATKFADIAKLEKNLSDLVKVDCVKSAREVSNKLAIAVGSRAHLDEDSSVQRTPFRVILMRGFHLMVWLFNVRGIKDTQCGFKLFTREAARVCFESIHVERWAFDVELLFIAQTLNIPIGEVPVNWHEIDGSKLTPIWSAIQMGRDLILIWLRYLIGAWKIKAAKGE